MKLFCLMDFSIISNCCEKLGKQECVEILKRVNSSRHYGSIRNRQQLTAGSVGTVLVNLAIEIPIM